LLKKLETKEKTLALAEEGTLTTSNAKTSFDIKSFLK